MKRRSLGWWTLGVLVLAMPFLGVLALERGERRRELELVESIEDEERELARPIVRPVLRGEATPGDVLEPLARVLAEARSAPFKEGVFNGRIITAGLPELTASERATLAGLVLDSRRALQHEECAPREIERLELGGLRVLDEAFVLEARCAAKDGQSLEAARILLDALRVRHDLAREALPHLVGWIVSRGPIWIGELAMVLPRLDVAGCDEVVRETRLLESSLPSFADSIRRERLERRRAFVAGLDADGLMRRVLSRRVAWGRLEADDTALAVAQGQARELPASLGFFDLAGRNPPRPLSRSARSEMERLVEDSNEKDMGMDREEAPYLLVRDLTALRALEAAAVAAGARLILGVWPPTSHVLHPRNGEPLVLVRLDDGGLRIDEPLGVHGTKPRALLELHLP